MIKNQWYAVLQSKEVKKGKLIGVTRLNEKLVLWRDSGDIVHCIFDQCCHRGVSLSAGCLDEDEVVCPFHGFKYDGSGKVTLIPANGKSQKVPDRFRVNNFPVKEAYGLIWLWYGDSTENLPELPFFEDLKEGFYYDTFKEVWGVHYSRAIENQLDVVHVPFVHTKTIGRGNRTVVNGPVVKWDEELMTFYVNNVVDQGQKPLTPNQIENYTSLFHLQYRVPNLWQNCISDDVRVFAAFAPIDEEHTMIYLRFYQKFMTVPVIGHFITWAGNIFNRKVLHEDRRVVITQLPKKTSLSMGEKLIQGDLPIIEYRKIRKRLQEE